MKGKFMNAVLKYPGSKWNLASWIINYFPEHHSYLEPFFGSGAVLFNKRRSDIETINDLDGDVVNLFECIREDPEKLAGYIYMTPYARDIYEAAYQYNPSDKYEKALNFYIRLSMGYGFRTTGKRVGWKNDIHGRERAYAALDWCKLPDKILVAAERLRGVQIENRSAIDLIKKFNYKDVLIYCDPPYMLETRHCKQYRYEMNKSGHEELLCILKRHSGQVIISGYDTELYNRELRSWNRMSRTAYTQSGTKKEEVIWMNFDPPNQQITFDI